MRLLDLTRIVGILAVAIALTAGAADAAPVTVAVNCGLGQKIQEALLNSGNPLTIKITGSTQCVENVVITRDDVTLQGDPLLAITSLVVNGLDHDKPTITLDGARRVTIDKLLVKGGQPGILATRGASVILKNCRATANTTFGVVSNFNSTMWIRTCNIDGNPSFGVIATNGGAVVMTGGTASNNGRAGILAVRGGVLRIGQDELGTRTAIGVIINGNHEGGVTATDGSSLILVGSTGSGNTNGNGVSVLRTSSGRIGVGGNGTPIVADFEAPNTITGNGGNGIAVFESSTAQIVGNTISNSASNGIVVTVSAAATILGNTISTSAAWGILVSEAPSARIGVNDTSTALRGNTLTTSTSDGIGVFDSANARIGGNSITTSGGNGVSVAQATAALTGGNTMFSNTQNGVFIGRNASLFQQVLTSAVAQDMIRNNLQAGVNLFEGGVAQFVGPVTIRQNTARGILASLGSRIFARNTTIASNTGDGVSLFHGSSLFIPLDITPGVSNVSITGNTGFGVRCFDAESSFAADASKILLNTLGAVSCSGF